MRTTPTASLGMILEVLHVNIKGSAANSAHRLRAYWQWKPGTRHSKTPLLEEPLLGMKTDSIPQRFHFGRNWTVTIRSWEEWLQHRNSLPGHGAVWYTVGPRSKDRSRAKYYRRRDVSVPGAVCDRIADHGHSYTMLRPEAWGPQHRGQAHQYLFWQPGGPQGTYSTGYRNASGFFSYGYWDTPVSEAMR